MRAYSKESHLFLDINDRDTAGNFYIDEKQADNIWRIGSPGKKTFDNAHSSPFALITDSVNNYPTNNRSTFKFAINSDDLTQVFFWHKYETDSLKDGGIIEASIDNGATWKNLTKIIDPRFSNSNIYTDSSTISSYSNNPGFTGNSGGWVKSVFSYYPHRTGTYLFRFTFSSDNINTNKAGWMVDDITINCMGTGGVKNVNSSSQINIFPNPSSGFISIQSENSMQLMSFEIKDLQGRTIFVSDKNPIDLSGFETGVYVIEVTTKTDRYITRIIKE